MQAYRIVDWWKFEMTNKGRLATANTPMESLRKTPLVYVRFPVHGHYLSPDYRRMVKRAGPEMATACDGVYKMLVGMAGNQFREYRGWILDDRQRPLNKKQVAELLCLSENKVKQAYEVLLDNEVKWLEVVEYPNSLHHSGKGGVEMESSGVSLNETVTEDVTVTEDEAVTVTKEDKSFGFETHAGAREAEGVQGEDVQLPARPAALASASASVPDSGTASASKKPSASDSVSDPVSDSASQPGPRAGPEEYFSGPISRQQRFEIIRECQKAVLELTQIIHPRNNSDVTTINDIFSQLQQRLIAGSPYPLFELSLNTARQCWRGDKPIAMFVAAMKKPPFYYVPRKLNVIPGKFSRAKDNK